MKILLYSVIGLFVIAFLYFAGLSVASRKQPAAGMLNDQLRACPSTPNCVCSERQGTAAWIEPLPLTTTVEDAWRNAKKAVVETGGVIVIERDGYLHAHFVTPFLRYIDDVELRLDESNQVIHVRSASRVGRSDFGANKARVMKLRKAFLEYSGG